MGRLDDKVAVVTGSASGIGKQIALCFAREGANIVANDIVVNDAMGAALEATAKEISNLGRKAITVVADVSQKGDVERLFEVAVNHFKKVHILVNNAGVAGRASLLETTEQLWDRVIDVNLKGVFLCTQAVAPHMIKQKYGKIINISSVAGLGAVGASVRTGSVTYSPAKAGVVQLTKNCARELGPFGINVNSIAPGAIVTPGTYERKPGEVDIFFEERVKITCLGRMGTTEDVANLALFLASDESSFITGQTIACDGGRVDRM